MFLAKHWFFVTGRCGPKQWGDPSAQIKQWPNGSAAARSLFGRRFEPRQGEFYAAAAATKSQPTEIRTANRNLYVSCVTIRPAVVC